MVDFGTNNSKFRFVPRKKSKIFFCFVELTIYFLLERNYVQASKYVMVTGVYPSRIGFKGIVA